MKSPGFARLFRNLRLKLLAVALALGLLLAVAFSENPLTIRQYNAPIRYADPPAGLTIIQPPTHVTITLTGLSSAVRTLNDSNTFTTVDLSKIKAGPSQTVLAQPSVLVNGVSVQGGAVPLSLTVQELKTLSFDIQVNVKGGPGYQIDPSKTYAFCNNPAQPCQVLISAPVGYLDSLVAYVDVQGQISNTNEVVPNLPIKFKQTDRALELQALNTFPKPSISPTEVTGVQITATKSASTKPVTAVPRFTGQPACGFGVSRFSVTNNGAVLVSGPSDLVDKVPDQIPLPFLDLSNSSGQVSATFAVPLSDPKLQADPPRVTVTAQMQRLIDCTPTTPAPTPTPSPTPSRSP